MRDGELTEIEQESFNEIVHNTLDALVDCADKYNIDRDSFIKYFCAVFSAMAELATFEHYKEGGEE